MAEIENSNISFLGDINGILSLYEPSFLLFESEHFLEEAKCFAINDLEKYMRRTSMDDVDVAMIKHALELPLHWRMSRMEARWFIDIYERKKDMNPTLLAMAKLDFNMLQSSYQEDLKYASRWDVNAIDQLPYYMRVCFLALRNSINEIAFQVVKDQGVDVIQFLKNVIE
ncbi:unnamed protein product [Citrullus colocynthis]|uniref:Terpene synthase metal-binding domain-containing protein n=1 Tax=Citrullus colocynthis TaxID=252529 RepID=A0ABP0Y774_9ROSI